MMIAIPDLLASEEVARVRAIIDAGDWRDGNATSGPQSALAKRNCQLPEDSVEAREAGRIILEALGRSPLFIAAALPLKIFPPLFNRYQGGEAFGTHVDNAVRIHRSSEFRVRTDLSATLFLEDPGAYAFRGAPRAPRAELRRRPEPGSGERDLPARPATGLAAAARAAATARASVPGAGISLEYPLRPDLLAQVVVPRDLTVEEARRMGAFLVTLAVDFRPASS